MYGLRRLKRLRSIRPVSLDRILVSENLCCLFYRVAIFRRRPFPFHSFRGQRLVYLMLMSLRIRLMQSTVLSVCRYFMP